MNYCLFIGLVMTIVPIIIFLDSDWDNNKERFTFWAIFLYIMLVSFLLTKGLTH